MLSYYVHPPSSLFGKEILLVPYAQVQQFLDQISERFKAHISVPNFPFTLSFYEDGTPQPVRLGTSHSRDDHNNLVMSIPAPAANHGECPSGASRALDRSFEAFKAKCENAIAANKKKGTAAKKKKAGDRFLAVQDWCKQLKRAQQYLGLRPRTTQPALPDANTSWDEQETFRQQQLKLCNLVLEPLDPTLPVPYSFDKEPVIISVDIEAYEHAHHIITEIGVSTLDTLDLVNIPPGPHGENWTKQIRSRHFRIKGREHLRNKDFCTGDPDAFRFGESEFVDVDKAADVVDDCFEWPFSVQYKHDGKPPSWATFHNGMDSAATNRNGEQGVGIHGSTNTEQDAANKAAGFQVLGEINQAEAAVIPPLSASNDPTLLQKGPKVRNLIFLGHDIGADLAYLENLGSKIFGAARNTYPVLGMEIMATGEGTSVPPVSRAGNLTGTGRAKVLASVLEALDTAVLYRVMKKESQNRNLANILYDVGLVGWDLHNGGNDARYTLEAFVAMAMKARLEDDAAQENEQQSEVRPGFDGSNEGQNEKQRLINKRVRHYQPCVTLVLVMLTLLFSRPMQHAMKSPSNVQHGKQPTQVAYRRHCSTAPSSLPACPSCPPRRSSLLSTKVMLKKAMTTRAFHLAVTSKTQSTQLHSSDSRNFHSMMVNRPESRSMRSCRRPTTRKPRSRRRG